MAGTARRSTATPAACSTTCCARCSCRAAPCRCTCCACTAAPPLVDGGALPLGPAPDPAAPDPMTAHLAALAPRVVLAIGPLAAQQLMRQRRAARQAARPGRAGWREPPDAPVVASYPRPTCCATRPTRRGPGPTCAWRRRPSTSPHMSRPAARATPQRSTRSAQPVRPPGRRIAASTSRPSLRRQAARRRAAEPARCCASGSIPSRRAFRPGCSGDAGRIYDFCAAHRRRHGRPGDRLQAADRLLRGAPRRRRSSSA